MKVLVTGGAGSIGVHVVRALIERGDEVFVVDNFNDYYDPEFKRVRFEKVLAGLQTPKLYEVDITDNAKLGECFAEVKPEKVIHLAAWAAVRPSVENPLLYTQQNVDGTVNVFEQSRIHGVKNVVFASSSSLYGRGLKPPYVETMPCDEPIAPYAASKRSGELYAWMYNYLHNLPIICLRFFTVYGPWMRPDMATWKLNEGIFKSEEITVKKFTPDGQETKRDFTYVGDIVVGIIAALDKNIGFDIVNLGNNDPVPLARFVAAIEAGLGMKAKVVEKTLPAEEAIVTAADITHAKEVLGFQPKVSIEEGQKRFSEWYKDEYQRFFPQGIKKSKYWN
ncbi:MAG: GDP-mannose 4,6-dehydratase [bacterium]|nr:GDP-mannose 4,6-dehydratase [bacterium]